MKIGERKTSVDNSRAVITAVRVNQRTNITTVNVEVDYTSHGIRAMYFNTDFEKMESFFK